MSWIIFVWHALHVTGSNGDLMYDLINKRGRPLVVNGAIWRIRMNGVTK